ncbi:MAG: translation initiation factor IF-3 [Candidatus Omnitrophica bacterium CG11_big_fil_rev_8_21_14_0_20_45_26]|uniref:Translation initiation factor IF-3 n=1 Tax=Candidatus Abzuiibacterium crystallinum TaxID=1974748 RepID=A0A2H0LS00_9BACT|nr:MAG: translation initiation factor IF-3 [Candidatus Omnitrophica bacterium CG11_big_fil_rev_8_21_14_0_20_45_26]PIW64959.1 MAG: translation initiation factor IF-3 [Candidatus Omnitrophica bacterium CG12_big_fil_rev_8_21_14_0_65_45_16]
MRRQHRVRANGQIRVPQIRLIDETGKQVGVVTVPEGLARAREAGLDLVEISPTAKPPVCRIIDFGKYLYMLEKQEKEARKKQHVITIKEIKLTSNIEDHDYHTKLRSAINFLERGDKVKVTLRFRGREITRQEFGHRVLDRFTEDLADVAELERNFGMESKSIALLFSPRKIQLKKNSKPEGALTENQSESKIDAETQNE